MGRRLKKLGKNLKKFAKSRVGKIALIGAGVAGAAFGGPALLAAAKAGKLGKVFGAGAKGIGKKKAGGKLAKGLFGRLKGKKADHGGEVVKGSLGRLSKRLKKRAARVANRLTKKQAKLDIQKMNAQQALNIARESLGQKDLSPEIKNQIEGEIGTLQNEAQNLVDSSLPDVSEDTEPDAIATLVKNEGRGMRLSGGNDTLKKFAVVGGTALGLSLLIPSVRKKIFG